MGEFTKNPLKALDGIYRFLGGMSGLRRFALESEIQPVHDVSRLAELAGFGGRQGYWLAQATQLHVAAGEIANSITPYASTNSLNGWLNPLPSDLRVWVIDCFANRISGTASLFEAAAVVMVYPAEMVGPSDAAAGLDQNVLLWRGDILNAFVDAVDDDTAPAKKFAMPALLEPGQLLSLSSQQAGAGAIGIRVAALLWVGTAGTTPPGLR